MISRNESLVGGVWLSSASGVTGLGNALSGVLKSVNVEWISEYSDSEETSELSPTRGRGELDRLWGALLDEGVLGLVVSTMEESFTVVSPGREWSDKRSADVNVSNESRFLTTSFST